MGLAACDHGASGSATASVTADSPITSQAASSALSVSPARPGTTPFVSFVDVSGVGIENLTGIEFTIAPKPGSISRPVHVQYTMAALYRKHFVFDYGLRQIGLVSVPIFGLYAGLENQVTLQLDFHDGSTTSRGAIIATTAYTDPNGIYDHPTILKPRAAGSTLGFDFFVMKSGLGTPVVVDTDGEIRWVGKATIDSSISSALDNDGFVIGKQTSATQVVPTVYRLGFDGQLTESVLPQPPFLFFHHNIDYGKVGFFAEVNDVVNGVSNNESTVIEMDGNGVVERTWELGDIVSAYMRSQGDDPSSFVRPGVDWFHANAATYDPRDDSIIVSSRENFLIKLDYSTGNIIWILGDPTKYWYTFPSLRAKALTLQPGGLYPIGQHAVSITSDGLVMVFNDGYASLNQPSGAPTGASRTYSAVSAYSIDLGTNTASEAWRFDYNQSIYSFICSSAYEASGGSILLDYAAAAGDTEARLVGLDPSHNVVFDFQYANKGCNTSWNATPIAFDNYSIT